MNFPEYPPDAILTPEEVSAALRLDRRTIVRLASELGSVGTIGTARLERAQQMSERCGRTCLT